MKTTLLLCTAFFLNTAAADLTVATTHPLLSDLARQIGSKTVEVVDLVKPGTELHHFEPSASQIKALQKSHLLLASGKHLESYLDKLKDALGSGMTILEVGKTIPSLKVEAGSEIFMCCPEHAAGGVDPHWWHSAENMARAAKIIAEQFATMDAANAAAYRTNGQAVAAKMLDLKKWAQKEMASIPKSERKIVTAHAAFGYLCKEYGLQFIPLLGLSAEDDYSAKYVTKAVQTIRDKKIVGLFPEDGANPKILQEIAKQTGVKLSTPLNADGTMPGEGSTFEGMLRHNIIAIVTALKK